MERCVDLITLSEEEKRNFRGKYDVFFFDMDGTLAFLNKKPIAGATEMVATLARLGKKLYLFTDNCIHTREDLAKSVLAHFSHFKEDNIITAVWLLIRHLTKIGFKKKIYAIGEAKGMVKELRDAGFQVISDDEVRQAHLSNLFRTRLDPDVGAVVVGVDLNISYMKIFKAANYLRDESVMFFISFSSPIAHNDPIILGPAAMVMPIQSTIGREPTSFCKSSLNSVSYIQSLGYDMSRCLFVGDGFSDMSCGNRSGMDTLLVLSGASDLDMVEKARREGQVHKVPTYFAESVADLGRMYAED